MLSDLIIQDIYKLLTNKSLVFNNAIKIKFFNLSDIDITNVLFLPSEFSFDASYWNVNLNTVKNSKALNFGNANQDYNSTINLKLYKADNTYITTISYSLILINGNNYSIDINTFNFKLNTNMLSQLLANKTLDYLFCKSNSTFSTLYLQIFDSNNQPLLSNRLQLSSINWSSLYKNIVGQWQFDYFLSDDIEVTINSNILDAIKFRLYDTPISTDVIAEGDFFNYFEIYENTLILSNGSISIVFDTDKKLENINNEIKQWNNLDINGWMNIDFSQVKEFI